MSDITASVVIGMPNQLFTMARSFKAVSNGKIYIGKPDTDPVNPTNQIPVYVENEDGSHVQVAQPIVINAGGYPVYNGQVVRFVTSQTHSMAVYDAFGVQQFYFSNVGRVNYFPTRQSLVDYPSKNMFPEGAVVTAGGLEYIRDSSSSSIPDLIGFKPPYLATLDHWDAPIDGTSDTSPFAQLALNWMALSPGNKIHEPNVITRKFTSQISTTGHLNWDAGNAHYIIDAGDTWLSAEGNVGNDSNLLIVFYVQIMPDDLVMQLHRF